MGSLLIKNAILNEEKTDVLVEGTKIARVGRIEEEADRILDASGKAIMPSFINGHTHAAMTLFRGYADDMMLMDWLQNKIWPLEAKITPEEVYWGTKFACLEMIRNGVTFFNDMYWEWEAAARAAKDMGLRAFIPGVCIDNFDPKKARNDRDRIEREFKISALYSPLVTFEVGPHAIYTVSEENLRWIAAFAHEHDLMIHMHLSETQTEVDNCLKRHGMRPVEYLDGIGFLSGRLIATHCVWLDSREMDILAEKGVNAVTNPCSNLKLAVNKIFPFSRLKRRGIRMTMGTDGAASNNNLDMLETAKISALITKWAENDPTAMNVRDAFDMITRNGSEIFHLNNGEIKAGKDADLVLVDLSDPALVPNHNLISNMIYSANGSCVDTTICQGRILMENKKIPGSEELTDRMKEISCKFIIK
ncbi:amidohydrolase [bacterium]|nr:amidohydrolase [bacterium]